MAVTPGTGSGADADERAGAGDVGARDGEAFDGPFDAGEVAAGEREDESDAADDDGREPAARNIDVVEAHLAPGPPILPYVLGPFSLWIFPVIAVLHRLERHIDAHARAHDPRTGELDGWVLERMARLEDEAHDVRSIHTARVAVVALLVLSGLTTAFALASVDYPPSGVELLLVLSAPGYHVALVLGPFTLWLARRIRRHEQAASGLRALERGLPPQALATLLTVRERHWRMVSSTNTVWMIALLIAPVVNLLFCALAPHLMFAPLVDHERYERGRPAPRIVPRLRRTSRRCSFCGATAVERAAILGTDGSHPTICDQCAFALAQRFALEHRRGTDRVPPLGDPSLGAPEDD